ncbi:MAG: adenosylcobinamide-GDP ribazoletransferase [Clostridia bacterium]|nr:adenosylcobinamide-GDP ribazoletransferase [Clostridia bacterium]
MRLMASLAIAFSTYSRIPMPRVEWSEENRRYALCFFPLVGLAVGAAEALWLWLCQRLHLGGFLQGTVAASLPLLVTGGIHMDGFMDTCDALASWQPPEKRLEILKDSHIGAFAALWSGLYLLATAGLYSECAPRDALALTACFLLSRALSAVLAISVKQARPGGMLDGFSSTAAGNAVKICGILYAAIASTALVSHRGWLALPAAACVALYYRRMAVKRFGGVTGDLAGWFLQMCELSCLAAIVLGGKLL